jgi:hypothetical protein
MRTKLRLPIGIYVLLHHWPKIFFWVIDDYRASLDTCGNPWTAKHVLENAGSWICEPQARDLAVDLDSVHSAPEIKKYVI